MKTICQLLHTKKKKILSGVRIYYIIILCTKKRPRLLRKYILYTAYFILVSMRQKKTGQN